MLCLSQACLGKSSCVIIATNRKLTPKAVLCIYSTHGTGGSLSADGWQPHARACLLATCAAPQRGRTRGRSRRAICAAVVRFPSVVNLRVITMMQCTYFDRKSRRRLLRSLRESHKGCYSRRQCDYPVLSYLRVSNSGIHTDVLHLYRRWSEQLLLPALLFWSGRHACQRHDDADE